MRNGSRRDFRIAVLLLTSITTLTTLPGCESSGSVTTLSCILGAIWASFPTFVTIGTSLWNYFRQNNADSGTPSGAPVLEPVITPEVPDAEGPVIGLDSSDAEVWELMKEYGWGPDSDVCRWHDDGGALGPGD